MYNKISVLLTTYNSSEFIPTSIKSVLAQTYQNFELIIIDDGSEDESEIIIKKFTDARIKYFRIEHIGYSGAVNYGLGKCRNDLIALQDSDDIWLPDKLMNQIKVLNNSVNFVVCKAAYFTNNKIKFLIDLPVSPDSLKKIWILHGHIATSGLLLRKGLLSAAGGFDIQNDIASDYDFFLKIIKDVKIGFMKEVGVLVRIRTDSLSRSNIIKRNKIIYNIQRDYYKDLAHNFGISRIKEQNRLLGWREWFYGSKSKSRYFWFKSPSLLFSIKTLLAILLTFIPNKFLIRFQTINLKYQLKFIMNNRNLKSKLKDFLISIAEN